MAANNTCPYLAGKFVCAKDNMKMDLTVSQSTENDITSYVVVMTYDGNANHTTTIADNIAYPYSEKTDDYSLEGSLKSHCADNILVSEDYGNVKDPKGNLIQSYEIHEYAHIDDQNNLEVLTIQNTTEHGSNNRSTYSMTCTRL